MAMGAVQSKGVGDVSGEAMEDYGSNPMGKGMLETKSQGRH